MAGACANRKEQTSINGNDGGTEQDDGPARANPGDSSRPRANPGGATVTTAAGASGFAYRPAGSETTTPSDDTTAATPSDDTTAATSGDTTAATSGDTTAGTSGDTTAATSGDTTPPASTIEPVMGGSLVVAGEAEVGAPWTPANVQCDSYCQLRIRTFIEPLMAIDTDQQLVPFLAESMTPNEDYSVWTIKVREGINFTDGTPLNADAVIDNLNRQVKSALVSGALKDLAKDADGNLVFQKIDDYTVALQTGENGDPAKPISWPGLPLFFALQAGFIASPTWLAAVDAGTAQSIDAVGTGPFTVQSYLPGDRMTVVKNPDYWRTDAQGRQLPYLDSIEFRVIPDSQVREAALTSGDVDLISTADANVLVNFLDSPDFEVQQQQEYVETNYVMLHLTVPQLQSREVRCALQQGIDQQALMDEVFSGYPLPANGPFSPGQDGYLDDTGLPAYDPDAAAAAIEAYEAENGPVTLRYSTTPTGTTKAIADFLQQAWTDIGVDVQVDTIEQSVLITNAVLGSPDFEAFGWRNHGGISADTQYHWWSSRAAGPRGEQALDGMFALNFGRLTDPVIDDLLDKVRREPDPETRAGYAQDINRQFAKECWILPMYWTTWSTIYQPAVQGIGQDPTPDGTAILQDGTGFGGQVWLTSAFLSQ